MSASPYESTRVLEKDVERHIDDMRARWQRGERPRTEDYLEACPELRNCPEAAIELICEELMLRQEDDTGAGSTDLLKRFPQWRTLIQAVLDCHVVFGGAAASSFIAVGETLGDFRLLDELGQGARGRVFLAAQRSLADRQVVLKVTPLDGREHLTLARLQHTHIVPLYAVWDDPRRQLRALCFPYFGGCTLAALLGRLRSLAPAKRSGASLIEALRREQAELPPAPGDGPGCRFLEQATYVQALCWIGACLADALDDAAEHGLVHLDVKPSNILLTADAQPMLLDFHLAQGSIKAGQRLPGTLGGTPRYMAPEHQAAWDALLKTKEAPTTIDGRADIYALGLVLYEALGGFLPPPADPGAALMQANPQVTRGLADVLAHCLARDPLERYARASDLAADLGRYLNDEPLRGVANRSVRERWSKWRRRRPLALTRLTLVFVVLTAAGLGLLHAAKLHTRAQAALAQGQTLLQVERNAEARSSFEHGLALIEDLPSGALAADLREQLRRAVCAQVAAEIKQVASELRGVRHEPPPDLVPLLVKCRAFVAERRALLDQLGADKADDAVRAELREVQSLIDEIQARATTPRPPGNL